MELSERIETQGVEHQEAITELEKRIAEAERTKVELDEDDEEILFSASSASSEERSHAADHLKKDYVEVQECLRLTTIERNNLMVSHW